MPRRIVHGGRNGHRRVFRNCSAAASRRSARRRLSAAYWKQVTGALAGRVQSRDGLIEVDADPPDQAGGTDQLGQRLTQRHIRCRDLAPGRFQCGLGRECAPG